ncbi:hypothetical protein [Methanoregula sp.]|uniref:hypothetical protein n=1 Tax=Methanoregula sp. TaxID=2052170 RepID=UPI00356B3AC1
MDTGKILTGVAFLLLSVALMVSPSSAEMQGLHCEAGSAPVALLGEPNGISLDIREIPAFTGTGLSPKDHPAQLNLPYLLNPGS